MTYVTLSGHEYPLKFGMLATRELIKTFGSLREVIDRLSSENQDISTETLFEVAFQLINNGIMAESFENEDTTLHESLPKFKSAKHIEAVTDFIECAKLFNAVNECLSSDTESRISVESVSDTSASEKNLLTTPEN